MLAKRPKRNLRAAVRAQKIGAKGSGLALGLNGKTRIKGSMVSEPLAHRFYQQVCNHLHMFILIGDDQIHRELPSTLFLRLLQLAIASIDRYEPWDQDSLISVVRYYLEGAQNVSTDDGKPFLPVLPTTLIQVLMRIQVSLPVSLFPEPGDPLHLFCLPSQIRRGSLFLPILL